MSTNRKRASSYILTDVPTLCANVLLLLLIHGFVQHFLTSRHSTTAIVKHLTKDTEYKQDSYHAGCTSLTAHRGTHSQVSSAIWNLFIINMYNECCTIDNSVICFTYQSHTVRSHAYIAISLIWAALHPCLHTRTYWPPQWATLA